MNPNVIPDSDLRSNEPPALSDAGRVWLAEGDSWFTLGSLNLKQNANVLVALSLAKRTTIVNCAYPGDTLGHMADLLCNPRFDSLLRQPNFSSWWQAILVSGGGNDLIDAVQHRAVHADGTAAALEERVLLTPAEAALVHPGVSGPTRYVSTEGWTQFAKYLIANYSALAARRDEGPSRARPIFLHTYHPPVVRASGTVGSPRGWLFEAFARYGIARAEQQALADHVFGLLRQLLLSLDADSGSAQALPQVHVFDSASLVPLLPARPEDNKVSGDWVNEIHPNKAGYIKMGKLMGPWIEGLLASRYA
jgi:lysophospholipase L1-like esterase